MFVSERHAAIVELLQHAGKVNVKDLCQRFQVTEDCIRKDLKKLEGEGLLQRTYGGALPLRQRPVIAALPERRTENLAVKQQIAEKALALIDDGDCLFLDNSTTNILLAKRIVESSRQVTVMTNMLDILQALQNAPQVTVFCPGGYYKPDINGFIGSQTNAVIRQYTFDKVFIGSCGMNVAGGYVTTIEAEEGETKRVIMEAGRAVYLVMENRKFQFDGFYKFADSSQISGVISEGPPSAEVAAALTEQQIVLL